MSPFYAAVFFIEFNTAALFVSTPRRQRDSCLRRNGLEGDGGIIGGFGIVVAQHCEIPAFAGMVCGVDGSVCLNWRRNGGFLPIVAGTTL